MYFQKYILLALEATADAQFERTTVFHCTFVSATYPSSYTPSFNTRLSLIFNRETD